MVLSSRSRLKNQRWLSFYFRGPGLVAKVPGDPRHYKVNTREYSYRLSDSASIEDDEIVAYHWHPNQFEVRHPHLHVRAGRRIHFPTSRVYLEDFVQMLIDYYDVEPIGSHDRWSGILGKNKAAFDIGATWKITPR